MAVKDPEGQRFYESEIDRLCAESGLNAGHNPLSAQIKVGESYLRDLSRTHQRGGRSSRN